MSIGLGDQNIPAIFFVGLFFVNSAFGWTLAKTKPAEVAKAMERMIYLVPIGDVEGEVLDVLEKDLARTFEARVKRRGAIALPAAAFNPARSQYSSSFILDEVRRLSGPQKQDKVFAITDVDLYASGLNFVFGEAEFGGHCAVISLTRLRQSFYALPENRDLFLERTKKEAVHELGHVWGLEHCPDRLCVMHFSNSLPDTDMKKSSFCPQCQARFGQLKK